MICEVEGDRDGCLGGVIMRSSVDRDLERSSLDRDQRRRIEETLGIMPRDALSALVDYGLHDGEIARYHRLSEDLVTELRELWNIPPNP